MARPAPPGSLLLALAGAAVGAFLAAAVHAGLWVAAHPGQSLDDLPSLLGGPALPFSITGFAVGFLATGLAVRNRLTLRIVGAVRRSLQLLVGAAAGLLFGAACHVGFYVASHPSEPLDAAIASLGEVGGRAGQFLLAGTLAGLLAASTLMGRRSIGSAFRHLGGLASGALTGLAIYVLGEVAIAYHEGTSQGIAADLAAAFSAVSVGMILAVGLGALAGAFLTRYSWRLYGLLTFISILAVVAGYLLYTIGVTLPHVPPEHRLLSHALFAVESTSLLMVLLYSFYTIDVAARKRWRRATSEAPFSPFYLPKVCIQVPTYNEPADLVKETLRCLMALDYPHDRFVIMVGDDSTRPERAEPIRKFCEEHGLHYTHRTDRTGYKAGMLNRLLREMPADCNLIAVVDADYQVEPNFLRETVGYFIDPELGWLQTPQDYRNRHQSFLTEQYYLADAYFYRTVLPSRNEENSIIFCGTMGMLRARAVVEAGGWGEKYITEDAELSVRLLNRGWRSLYVNKTYGRGLIPSDFEAYKRQHYRWAFGGGKIMRGHGLRLLFGRFTFRQRLDYLVGAVNWFEGAFVLAIALFVLGMGVGDVMGDAVVTHHSQEIMLIGLVPIFLLLDGLTRVHFVLRRSIQLGFGGTVRILGMWSSVKFSNTRAALKALLGFSIPFVRTRRQAAQRTSRRVALAQAFRITPFESFMAGLFAATTIGVVARVFSADASGELLAARASMAFWLLYYCVLFAAAPLYAYKSFSTASADAGPTMRLHTAPNDVPQDVNA
ncbi:MAG: hypothetical protein QOD77_2127 [Thermoplasmata archaeon]|jgi:glycosyltransferase involved in cell wall biosynthesis|nr:hypothetical protein [Thermoplasmata archaeon]